MKQLWVKMSMVLSTLALLPYAVHAQFGNALGKVNDIAGTQGAGYNTGSKGDLLVIIGGLIKGVLGLMGIIFVLYMIYAGYLWMTAQGDDKRVATSKAIIKNCVIGLVIMVLAYSITSFVFAKLMTATGSSPAPTGGVST